MTYRVRCLALGVDRQIEADGHLEALRVVLKPAMVGFFNQVTGGQYKMGQKLWQAFCGDSWGHYSWEVIEQ